MYLIKTTMSKTLTFGILLVLVITTSCGQTKKETVASTSKVDKIDEIVSLYHQYDGFNGSVLVAQEGEVIYKKGFGVANMEWDIPNQTDTKFRIASVTKPFTAILIMQLVEEGKLDLQVPISTYLPDYPKETGSQITIHQILTHTSGLTRDYSDKKTISKYPDRQRLKDLVKEFSSLPLEFVPGDHFAYSNTGYIVLSYIIETVTNKSYETILKENILDPLAMNNTGTDKHRPLIKNRAKGYFKSWGDYYNGDYADMSSIMGVGNIYSTVEDLFILDQALYTDTLLPKKYRDLLFTKHVDDSDEGDHYGYGWELKEKPIGNSEDNVITNGHSGSMNGFTALYTRIPASKSSVIFLNNSGGAFLNSMTTAITGILNDASYDFPRKPLAMFMNKVIEKEGIEKGIQYYKDHKDSSDYYVSEQELIIEGYRYLHAGNAKDAAEIFKLSTEAFPDRDNPYDSYAEALMTLGKNEEAIINYKKSIELNPNNNNAKEMLKKLEK